MRALPLVLKALAACWIVVSACCERFERSQSKNTMNDGGATTGGGGGGGGGAATNLYWMLAISEMLLLVVGDAADAKDLLMVGLVVPK